MQDRHHSVGNKAKIKPAVEELLRKKGYPYTEDPTGGIILVAFGTDAQPTHTRPEAVPQTHAKPAQQPEADAGPTMFSIVSSIAKFFFGLLCSTGASPPQHATRGGEDSGAAQHRQAQDKATNQNTGETQSVTKS